MGRSKSRSWSSRRSRRDRERERRRVRSRSRSGRSRSPGGGSSNGGGGSGGGSAWRRRDISTSRERSRERERRRRKAQAECIRRAGGFQKLADSEGHEPVRLFWDGFQWVAKTGNTQNLQTDPAIMNSTRKLRRLYFGNLPLHLGLTETGFQDIVWQEMRTRGFCSNPSENPVLYVWFAKDKGNYGFVEFASVEETERALTMDGMNCMGIPLKVSRPNDYSTASVAQNQVMTLMGQHAAHVLAASNAVVGGTQPQAGSIAPTTGISPHPACASTNTVGALAQGAVVPSPPPPPGLPPGSTKFLRIHEIINADNLNGLEEYLDVLEDVKEGCGQHGEILSGFIVSPETQASLPTFNLCDVFLEFTDPQSLDACMRNMHCRKYEGRLLNMERFDPRSFEQLIRPLILAPSNTSDVHVP